MKRTWTCPKCESQRVGYFARLVDQRGELAPEPRAVALGPKMVTGLLGGQHVIKAPVGEIEAFVCTECGYLEEYVKNPAALAWDQLEGFQWCNRPAG